MLQQQDCCHTQKAPAREMEHSLANEKRLTDSTLRLCSRKWMRIPETNFECLRPYSLRIYTSTTASRGHEDYGFDQQKSALLRSHKTYIIKFFTLICGIPPATYGLYYPSFKMCVNYGILLHMNCSFMIAICLYTINVQSKFR